MGVPFSKSQTQIISEAKCTSRSEALKSAQAWDEALYGKYVKVTATEIVKRIATREWTASEVLEAYISRAAYAQQLTNCVTEVMFEQARLRAKELDQEFAVTGKVVGPLHGVPLSAKDSFDFVDVDSTVGYTTWANKKKARQSEAVTALVQAGAIPFIKTNIPQTLFSFECSNPLWGRTTNPYSEHYTCGGSSGGEAALLGMDGSALGLGTDIGGSLRIPAIYCGIYSLKPGYGRVSKRRSTGPSPGFEGINAVAGPMARSMDDLITASKLLFGTGTDPSVAPIPYKEPELNPKLKFGYYRYDGLFKAAPACQRAVLEAAEALRRAGHDCVELSLPQDATQKALEIFIALTSADGYYALRSHLGTDPLEPANYLTFLGPRLPGFIRSTAAWIVANVLKDPRIASFLQHSSIKPMSEYMKYVAQRDEFVEWWEQEVWNKHGFDGIIGPGQALPQMPHGGSKEVIFLGCSTVLYNVVDSPTGVVPVTHVDITKDQLTEEWKAKEGGSGMIEGIMYNEKKPYYDLEKLKGMPVCVQIVGRKWEDEKVLSMMKLLDDSLGERGSGPGGWDEKRGRSRS